MRYTRALNCFGRLYITKELIAPCSPELLYLKDQVDVDGFAYDPATSGVEIAGKSHLFDPVWNPREHLPWYYPIAWEARGMFEKSYRSGQSGPSLPRQARSSLPLKIARAELEPGIVIFGILKSDFDWT